MNPLSNAANLAVIAVLLCAIHLSSAEKVPVSPYVLPSITPLKILSRSNDTLSFQVTCGSTIKLAHVSSKVRLHSHGKYRTCCILYCSQIVITWIFHYRGGILKGISATISHWISYVRRCSKLLGCSWN